MAREIAKAYEPQQIEPRWADYWVKEELFKADANAPGPVFSIVIPPPNVTGSLHIGHMLDHTEIDILTRWHRMRGYNTLYLPGTDHASISTQRVVVKQLAEQGINYRDLGREEFLKRVWKWKEESGGIITRQMKQIGESCDWSREKFTLSPELSRVVTEVFVRLHEEGLIYRENRLLNWCPVCLTVLSDLEVLHEERQGHLWYIKYPVAGTKDFIVVATTRPETMLGDTAVAVNPEDERYAHLVGKRVVLPLMNREIPIIADAMVDREFGTGAVKITPAHDPNDFEVGRRHKLAEIDVMTDDGKMNASAGAYAGMDRFEARKRIVEDLKALGLLEKITEHTNAIGLCERSKTIVEPRASTQWFCKMKPLAEPAIAAVEKGEIHIVPDNRREEFFNWMRNIRDWTLSRQLWWGHRIPAWYCAEHHHVTVAREAPTKCPQCGSEHLKQDEDVLDTWFSSGLWPFSTLGWPDKTPELARYYPGDVLVTGFDIIFFWVARMMMMGIHFMKDVPFRTVYIHGLVRDERGQKMSKSKGNAMDPLELIDRYGADALRFTICALTGPGRDIKLGESRVKDFRGFVTKLWNAARFCEMNEVRVDPTFDPGSVRSPLCRWIFDAANNATTAATEALEAYRFDEYALAGYRFVWNTYCDWFLEFAKPVFAEGGEAAVETRATAAHVFGTILRLLHPAMPFVTEELWHRFGYGAKWTLIREFWPEPVTVRDAEAARAELDWVVRLIGLVRSVRTEMNVPPSAPSP